MKRMLIIDDDTDILEALEALMDMEGYAVKISTRPEVIDRIQANDQPDMIIMDVLLSGKDGRQVVRKMRKQTITKGIPVLMISAHPNVRKSTLRAGANDFLAKPFETNELISKTRTLLGN